MANLTTFGKVARSHGMCHLNTPAPEQHNVRNTRHFVATFLPLSPVINFAAAQNLNTFQH